MKKALLILMGVTMFASNCVGSYKSTHINKEETTSISQTVNPENSNIDYVLEKEKEIFAFSQKPISDEQIMAAQAKINNYNIIVEEDSVINDIMRSMFVARQDFSIYDQEFNNIDEVKTKITAGDSKTNTSQSLLSMQAIERIDEIISEKTEFIKNPEDDKTFRNANRLANGLVNDQLDCDGKSITEMKICEYLEIPVHLTVTKGHSYLTYFDGVDYFSFDPETRTFNYKIDDKSKDVEFIAATDSAKIESMIKYNALIEYDEIERNLDMAKKLYDELKEANNLGNDSYLSLFKAKLQYMDGEHEQSFKTFQGFGKGLGVKLTKDDHNSYMHKFCQYKN